jgi:glycine/D-amino acid oxidase-like deaminating enzyme
MSDSAAEARTGGAVTVFRVGPTTVRQEYDVAVIGGGFYGLRIAAMAAGAGRTTVLFEREAFWGRASTNNQARVHGGYHYPRSILTAMRSREHYARFQRDFSGSIDGSFQHVYAIARHQTKVGAREFAEFCRRIAAPLSAAPRVFADKLDPNTVENAFLVEEAVFNASHLSVTSLESAQTAGTHCLWMFEVVAIEPGTRRRFRLHWRSSIGRGSIEADWVVNATYSSLNHLLAQSGLEQIPLIHEHTEIAIVVPPAAMRGYGVTVMDGPFWSCLPFPVFGAYSLSHVRYTPHARWRSDEAEPSERDAYPTHFPLMQRDAVRFLPAMRDAIHLRSLWETKTVLPRSAGDDSRPILVLQHHDAIGLVSVLGAKIDSVYDVEDALRDLILSA